MITDIKQLLTSNEYQAVRNANSPTALNPFATMADLAGAGTAVEQLYIAGENIAQGRVVAVVGGAIFHVDPTNASYYGKAIGVTKTSGLLGDAVTVVTSGYLNSLALVADTLYFVGLVGVLSTAPAGVLTQQIGTSISATEMIVDLKVPIKTI